MGALVGAFLVEVGKLCAAQATTFYTKDDEPLMQAIELAKDQGSRHFQETGRRLRTLGSLGTSLGGPLWKGMKLKVRVPSSTF